ncbi:MAG: phosphate ABC transporter permease subunit PstC [Gammaproteobacteria bacterium]|nr:phosphate ABC transporter permease subunit PstC [Gammaproteobacteria bacterium]
MNSIVILITAICLTLMSGFFGWQRSKNIHNLRSRPIYHGMNHGLKVALPMMMTASIWLISDNLIIKPTVMSDLTHNNQITLADPDFHYLQIVQIADGLIKENAFNATINKAVEHYRVTKQNTDSAIFWMMIIAGLLGFRGVTKKFHRNTPAREQVERIIKLLLAASSGVAVLTTAGIVLALLFETLRFFNQVPFTEFLFGTHWSPQMAIRADQVGSSGAFGALPLFAGTLLIALIAMAVAVPVGLYSAIYLSEYAQPKIRVVAKPALEILAGIPTVVYGFFAALTVAPLIVDLCEHFGISASSESALAAGLVMGVMIIPFVSSLSEDVISAVPQSLRDGSLAMGATKAETIVKVVLPSALPGIVSALLLAFSRAIGETMIVVMAAGLAANMTANPLESVTTITAQIVTTLVGDQSFDSPKTLSAFALGLTLFCFTLMLNIIALRVVRKYREQYA